MSSGEAGDGPAPGGRQRSWSPGSVLSNRTNRLLALAVAPFLVATIIGLLILWPDGDIPVEENQFGGTVVLVDGKVVAARAIPCAGNAAELRITCRLSDVRLTAGPDKGRTTSIEIIETPGQPELEKGDKVVLARSDDPLTGTVSYYFSDYQRKTPLIWLGLLFAIVVVAVGRLRGLAALAGLAVTFVLLISFVLPALLHGESPLAVAIVGSAAILFVILYLAHGITAQTTTALLGTLLSLAITGVLAAFFVDFARIVNLGTEESAILQANVSNLNLQGLFLAGVIIGSVGVLNDVTVTQASAVWAFRGFDRTAGFAQLYRSGMKVGRDHIASTVDTLVLAYAGASLPLLLAFTVASRPLGDVITGSFVAEEIVRTLVGGIGLAASVPITTGLAALVAGRSEPPPPDPPPPPPSPSVPAADEQPEP